MKFAGFLESFLVYGMFLFDLALIIYFTVQGL